MADSDVDKIAAIIHNQPLASALVRSIEAARRSGSVDMPRDSGTWDVFERSLSMAIRDIETHKLGKLFRRFIEYGPHNPDEPEAKESDGETMLSDPECGTCVEFIFSHMINRFKGELAELLALEPSVSFVEKLKREGVLADGAKLYWGDNIKERRRIRNSRRWGSFAKGADQLIVEHQGSKSVTVHGAVEVKSMVIPQERALRQIDRHIKRLSGGLILNGQESDRDNIKLPRRAGGIKRGNGIIKVMVIPSAWKVSREWSSQSYEKGRVLIFPEPTEPPIETTVSQLSPGSWCIRLAWSEEALNQAAYEMTFWYMSQVGKAVYEHKQMPKGWEYMSPPEAGYNAVKMMLYFVPLRIQYFRKPGLTGKRLNDYRSRIGLKTIRLYNVYSFGYGLGIDAKDMLWPQDFPEDKK
jgi:hypothetical protein